MELFRKYWHVAVLFAAAIVVCIPSIFTPASIIGRDESIGDRGHDTARDRLCGRRIGLPFLRES